MENDFCKVSNFVQVIEAYSQTMKMMTYLFFLFYLPLYVLTGWSDLNNQINTKLKFPLLIKKKLNIHRLC